MNKNKIVYQFNFSDKYSILYDDEPRKKKALKIIAVLNDLIGSTQDLRLLDIGSSTGIMTSYLSEHFYHTIGIDIDERGIEYSKANFENPKLNFIIGDALNLEFDDNTFDVVNCTHIYEHVPDSKRLMDEIYRILKPGGVCFFAAANRIILIEAHYKLPLLSIIPKFLAHKYLKLFNRGNYYYENHLTYWGLKKIVRKFSIIDYTKQIVHFPEKYYSTDLIKQNSIMQKLYLILLKYFYFISPTYIWILRKTNK